jgi:hypothetical protein
MARYQYEERREACERKARERMVREGRKAARERHVAAIREYAGVRS